LILNEVVAEVSAVVVEAARSSVILAAVLVLLGPETEPRPSFLAPKAAVVAAASVDLEVDPVVEEVSVEAVVDSRAVVVAVAATKVAAVVAAVVAALKVAAAEDSVVAAVVAVASMADPVAENPSNSIPQN
jgi:hypothetical protein